MQRSLAGQNPAFAFHTQSPVDLTSKSGIPFRLTSRLSNSKKYLLLTDDESVEGRDRVPPITQLAQHKIQTFHVIKATENPEGVTDALSDIKKVSLQNNWESEKGRLKCQRKGPTATVNPARGLE